MEIHFLIVEINDNTVQCISHMGERYEKSLRALPEGIKVGDAFTAFKRNNHPVIVPITLPEFLYKTIKSKERQEELLEKLKLKG